MVGYYRHVRASPSRLTLTAVYAGRAGRFGFTLTLRTAGFVLSIGIRRRERADFRAHPEEWARKSLRLAVDDGFLTDDAIVTSKSAPCSGLISMRAARAPEGALPLR